MNANALSERIEKHEARITVIGQGYVGLPLAIAFAHAGYTVIGLDNSREKVESLNQGRSPIPDVAHSDLQEMRAAGRYSATTDYAVLAETDAAIICVPTPLRKTKDPDISYVISAAEELAEQLHPGQLIVLESTTYPGTTEEILLPMFSEKGGEAGVDFFLAFSPERIDPANPKFKVRDIPKVVGGVTSECSKLASKLYQQVVPKVLEVSSPRVAEMAKLYENVFRNVNIALANELALMCKRLGVNTREVIDAASTKPFGFMPFHPGPGVGGHCIGIDSQYLAWKMKLNGYDARFIHLAEEINQSMPSRVVQMVSDALNDRQRSLKGANVLALGVAYKPNVSDIRESPALEVIDLLRKRGANVTYADPHVPNVSIDGTRFEAVAADKQAVKGSDCVVILTDHADFDYNQIAGDASLVLDTRNATWGIQNPKAEVIRL
ncbi:MAG TPA: nucleotide sugar dehydrogenase [Gammaproteobacteria bacterium]|nr:nucleotide sugar dehydrogenase [Gammaproteobacteria bacterium]